MTTLETITIDPTDLDSLANAVGLGITTPEMLADWIGVDLIDDCLVLEGSPVYADDGNAEIEYDSETTPDDAAQQYVDDGDWGEITATAWVTVATYRKGIDDSGEIVQVGCEWHKIALTPDEPDCIDGHDHDWQSPYSILGGLEENPGVWGSGGGVIIHECCMLCGCGRTTDTWAQDMSDGEQGLESVEYHDAEYADEVNDLHIQRAKDRLGADEIDGVLVAVINGERRDLCDEDELRDYGIALRLDPEAAPPANIGCEIDEDE